MPIILCGIDLFELVADVYVHGGSWNIGSTVDLDNLTETLVDLSKKYETNKIKFFGNKAYIQKFIDELNQNNEYEIEVN